MTARLSAGSTVETRCTRCKSVLNHTIVAMVGEKIVRVECSTCFGVHSYHPVKTAKVSGAVKSTANRAVTPRKAKADPEAVARAEWETLRLSIDPAQAINYDMTRTYRIRNVLSHPSFGLGVVQAVLPPNKIDVLFQSGKKLLRCG